MLKRNFINNIKRGLGSAFIELSNALNIEEYRESLVYCITHDCTYDFIFEGSKGDYLYRLINIYDDKSYFIDIVKSKLLNMKGYYLEEIKKEMKIILNTSLNKLLVEQKITCDFKCDKTRCNDCYIKNED